MGRRDINTSRGSRPEQASPAHRAGRFNLLSNYIYDFDQAFLAVEEFLFLCSKFDLAGYSGIYGVVVAETDTVTGDEFSPSLANDNIARLGDLTVV